MKLPGGQQETKLKVAVWFSQNTQSAERIALGYCGHQGCS